MVVFQVKHARIIILIAGMSVVAMSAYQYLGRPGRGDLAPVFKLSDTKGAVVSLEDFRGSSVVLAFWASWCDVCRVEYPSLLKLHEQYKDEGLVVLLVSEDAPDSLEFKSFLARHPSNLRILLDKGGKVADLYDSYSLPESLLIDKDGAIIRRFSGLVDWQGRKVEKILKEAVEWRRE